MIRYLDLMTLISVSLDAPWDFPFNMGDINCGDLFCRKIAALRYYLLQGLMDIQEIDMDPFMLAAINEAQQGLAEGGIPIGSVIVHRGRIIGRGHNRRVQQGSAILHGEMDAFENAGRQPASVYRESVLYTTLSPCAMCSGAILLYKIPKVIVGENRSFMGEEAMLRSRAVQVDVLQDETCIALMRDFIAAKPSLWNEDIGT
ncbi:hypothetical protein GCM10027278_33460 [Paralcaligenes ginsengisoli]